MRSVRAASDRRSRSLQGSERTAALPNLVIIGAQKCGTSSLHTYVGLHPAVQMSEPKELNFFVTERNWWRGVDWYRAHFDPSAEVRGESSPLYSAHPQFGHVPERMAETVPEVRILYLVRDPLDRLAASWIHNASLRRVNVQPRVAELGVTSIYVSMGMYYAQLARYLRHFDQEQIMVVEQDDLRRRRQATLGKVFEFIGVDPDFEHPEFSREAHRTSSKRRKSALAIWLAKRSETRTGRVLMPKRVVFAVDSRVPGRRSVPRPDVRRTLTDQALRALKDDAEQLRNFTGRRFDNWSIWDV